MNRDLLMALLSMDAYNRGTLAGLNLEGATIASASVVDTKNFADGFAAVVYSYGSEKIISYRGTDQLSLDALNGWPVAAGWHNSASQADDAVNLYKEVV